ncbi:hypothetical protein GCK32_021734 [Trichostrongylus colubriformis]|uniref:Salivary secreted protein n=1 Tax=Trichostrongylus colubriformis TaxID=6319 RepID=A0AAN8FFS8_TRICO
MRLIFLVLLLLFAAVHGRFVNRVKRELAAGGGTSKYPFAIQLKNGTTVYPYAMQLKDIDIKRNRGVNGTTVYPFAIQLKDIDIKGIRGESGVSEEKSEAKNVFEKAVGRVKKLQKKLHERKNTSKQ